MIGRLIAAFFGIIVAIDAAIATEEKTTYFCVSDVSGGLYFDEQLKKWRTTSFKPENNFVLSVQFISERTEYGVVKTVFRVSTTKTGSNYAATCSDGTE